MNDEILAERYACAAVVLAWKGPPPDRVSIAEAIALSILRRGVLTPGPFWPAHEPVDHEEHELRKLARAVGKAFRTGRLDTTDETIHRLDAFLDILDGIAPAAAQAERNAAAFKGCYELGQLAMNALAAWRRGASADGADGTNLAAFFGSGT